MGLSIHQVVHQFIIMMNCFTPHPVARGSVHLFAPSSVKRLRADINEVDNSTRKPH